MDIDWDSAPPWANFIAMDADGSWWWFEHRPHAGHLAWINHPGVSGKSERVKGAAFWRESLVNRPNAQPSQSS